MSFLYLDDVKPIITKHLINDTNVNKFFMTTPHDDLQKLLFGEIIFNVEYKKIEKYYMY
jgi:hypothetical protein